MRTSKGIVACAKRERAKNPRVSIVSIVSFQSKFPVPKITRITCARKVRRSTVDGIIKNKIWRKVAEKLFISFFLREDSADKVGNAAIAKDIPKIPTGKDCKLLAKLKTAKEPADSMDATAVITNKLICETAKLIVRGIIIIPIFLVSLSLKLIRGTYLNPKNAAAGI